MTIPDFQSLLLPVLKVSKSGEVRIGDVIALLADELRLTEEERSTLLPSGVQGMFANRVHWAKFYLIKAGLVEATRRGHFQITEEGRKVLSNPPDKITIEYLKQFQVFREFREETSSGKSADGGDGVAETSEDILTPDETIRQAHRQIESELAASLLLRVRSGTPAFFEKVVVNLLFAMGYGGSGADIARSLVGKSGDGGIDGVIDQDPLGLDRVYIQAKRYADGNVVGAGAIRDFFGSLDRFKASKGLFVTTSSFSSSAKETTDMLSKRIVLIDGQQLARLMIRHEVGCRVAETLHLKKEDEDFFE